jgi:hypothetical protein
LAADFVALFLGKYDPPGLSLPIPLSLQPPIVTLTTEQQFFAGGHLTSFQQISCDEPHKSECEVISEWATPAATGTTTL